MSKKSDYLVFRFCLSVAVGLMAALGIAACAGIATKPGPSTTRAEGKSVHPTNAYILRHPEVAVQKRLEVHYATHHRREFWIKAEQYELKFNMASPDIGVELFRPAGRGSNLLHKGSMNIRVTTPDGQVYNTNQARSQARINIFRHGPHYYDVHVYDLMPTNAKGDTLGLRGEVVFHAYPERLYTEIKLHKTADVPVASAEVEWRLDGKSFTHYVTNGGITAFSDQSSYKQNNPAAGFLLGVVSEANSIFGLLLPAPEGTSAVSLVKDRDVIRLNQSFNVNTKRKAPGTLREKDVFLSLYFRLYTDTTGGASGLREAQTLELNPLSGDAFRVSEGGVFKGYNSRKGHYTVATKSGYHVSYYYEHPNYMAIASLSIRNDSMSRKIYVKHEDALHSTRLESGVVTDSEGYALPILVQGSKNFAGEDEEPFYNPGDPAYSESYFPLILDPGEHVELRSYHAFQNWGNHPLKQISSLQAWMPYYQMSVGVTETTCYVPFRFGGHSGIWIADLRGVSGTMWESQPQFDNVGGHRYFHYRSEGQEHYLRYLRSWFDMTGPNMAHWGMDYVTEHGEARVSFDIFEFPQYDETRNFTTMRIDFDQSLHIKDPARNLHLISIDTRTQRLRYETIGYTGENGSLVEVSTDDHEHFPKGAILAREYPAVGMYQVKRQSKRHGNNAIIVRDFRGTMSGRRIEHLAVTADTLGKEELMISLTLPGREARFIPGDYIELSLLLMPYGKIGEGFDRPMKERLRYGKNAPAVEASIGQVISDFPSRVQVTQNEQAVFSIKGGYGRIPVLVEGFNDYLPPKLEILQDGGWERVQMTSQGNEGHHVYLTENQTFGFVFLVETKGNNIEFRISDS